MSEFYEPRVNPDGSYDTLTIDSTPGVDRVTLNRPESLNAMSRTMMLELQHYFGRLYTRHEVRVVLLTGAGRGFCSGLDLKEDRSDEPGAGPVAGMRVQRRVNEIMLRMRRAPQVIISLINGVASGGGFGLALASDIRIAAEGIRMNAAFIRIGLSACDVGVSYFLPRLAGSSLAYELLLTGDFVDADRALRCGLVSDVVSRDELAGRGEAMAASILRNSPIGVRLTKECLNMSVDAPSLESVIAMEDRQQILISATNDMSEGVAAFRAKREPHYADE